MAATAVGRARVALTITDPIRVPTPPEAANEFWPDLSRARRQVDRAWEQLQELTSQHAAQVSGSSDLSLWSVEVTADGELVAVPVTVLPEDIEEAWCDLERLREIEAYFTELIRRLKSYR